MILLTIFSIQPFLQKLFNIHSKTQIVRNKTLQKQSSLLFRQNPDKVGQTYEPKPQFSSHTECFKRVRCCRYSGSVNNSTILILPLLLQYKSIFQVSGKFSKLLCLLVTFTKTNHTWQHCQCYQGRLLDGWISIDLFRLESKIVFASIHY